MPTLFHDFHRPGPPTPHSYRRDPSVPPFPDDRPLALFDGTCVACTGLARFVIARDRDRVFRVATAQSPLGQALYRHYRLDATDFETNLLIVEGRMFTKRDAVSGILRRLPAPWPVAGALLDALPRRFGDFLYDRLARNRYTLRGRRDVCVMPDAGGRLVS